MQRARIEAWLAVLFLALAAAAAIFPTWVESVLPFSPDAGSGEFEWLIAGAVGLVAATLALDARRLARTAAKGS